MKQTFWDKWRHRFRGAWHVLTGRAWAGYGNPWEYDFSEFLPKQEPAICSERSRGPLGLD